MCKQSHIVGTFWLVCLERGCYTKGDKNTELPRAYYTIYMFRLSMI